MLVGLGDPWPTSYTAKYVTEKAMKREGQFAFPIFGRTILRIFTDHALLWYSDMGNPLAPFLTSTDLWFSGLGAI